MKTIITLALILFTIGLSAQTGSIVGKLTDKDFNNEPLPFANVIIKGTSTGTTSDIDGLYALENVPVGSYTIVFSFVGYETVELAATVEANKVTTINVPMGASAAALDEVVIKTTARRNSEVALLIEQKKAATITQNIGAEELSRKGVDNAASAVAQISGISQQQGSSEVYVRGLGDRYQNTTFNGLFLPSNNVNRKNIDLDLFPSEIIESVGVSKAYTSKYFGDFSAGNVNIVSKEYTGPGYLAVSVNSGFNSAAIGEDFLRSEGTSYFGFYNRYDNNPFAIVLSHGVDPDETGTAIPFNGSIEGGYSFNIDDNQRLSFFGTAIFGNSYEYREGPAVDFTNDVKLRFPEVEEYRYGTNTSALGSIIYNHKDGHKLKFSSLFSNTSKDEASFFGVGGNGFNRDGFSGNGDGGFYQSNVQFDQDIIFVNQLNGTHTINEDWLVDWGVGFNKVFSDQPDRKRISLEDYQFTLDDDPTTNPIFYDNIVFDNQRYFQSIEDDELNSYLNVNYKVSENINFTVGYNGRTKERRFNNWRYGYEILDKNANPVLDPLSLNDFFSPTNLGSLWNLQVATNPQGLDAIIGLTNVPQLYENTYQGNLDIHAGLFEASITAGDFLFVPGVRIENWSQFIEYDVINPVPTDPGFRDVTDNLFFPSLNIKYALNEDMNLRLAGSLTASYPEFKEAANFVYEEVTQRIGGNPDVLGKADGTGAAYSEIFNADLKYEWFPGRNELIALSLFSKTIKDPINLVVATDATGTQRYFRTGDQADVFGVELELRKNLVLDADENPLFTVGGNFAYTNTNQDLKTVSTTDGFSYGTSFGDRTESELQGASEFIANADINYTPTFGNYKPKVTAVVSYFSDRIAALGSGGLGDIIEKSVPTVNLVWRNSFGDHFEANLSVKNILNPDVTRVRENTGAQSSPFLTEFGLINDAGDVTLREYKRGINVGLTLKYKL
ncbi:TonB-dependent receptor [Patiriisocius hiemis]|uniref:Carboxypeptidase-like regulatory domain-containing protein n=1 Tax=Patiriisocius hiemis TaxID=3075604 RepID=A0ABU2YBS7_9FLAO|nr:carboxypeptidase-like regulatory domain-containing protein [Constantimarinum sp. W242]MDT0555326.1 carboxypeptidase-like regulatory domain-containing protein [Constantimarinum sp. W242]